MTTINAQVTRGKTFTEDAANEVDVSSDDLNLLGVPTVSTDLSASVDTEDLVADGVDAAALSDSLADQLLTASITISDEATNVVTATIQIQDAKGESLADQVYIELILSDAAAGALTGTAPDGAVAASTGTIVASHTAKTHILVLTNAAGLAVVTYTETGSLVRYMNGKLNDLYIAGSQAMTWAA